MKVCTFCGSKQIVKNGIVGGKQRYKCKQCNHNPRDRVQKKDHPMQLSVCNECKNIAIVKTYNIARRSFTLCRNCKCVFTKYKEECNVYKKESDIDAKRILLRLFIERSSIREAARESNIPLTTAHRFIKKHREFIYDMEQTMKMKEDSELTVNVMIDSVIGMLEYEEEDKDIEREERMERRKALKK